MGGQSNQIVLWPLGGVAYVNAPQRPGAQLWSIAAGPLVNVILIPVIIGIDILLTMTGLVAPDAHDFWRCFGMIGYINIALLIFNILPIYPLDGGQILRSLLWFKFGPRLSLLYASGVGLVGAAGLVALAIYWQSLWLGVLVAFLGSNSWKAFQAARSVR